MGRDDLSLESLALGLIFLALGVPLRLATVLTHRRFRLLENPEQAWRVTVPLLPTLVFTLVIAGILRETFAISPVLFGGLVVYALGTTLLPSLILRTPPPEFDSPEAPPLTPPAPV